MRMHATPYAGSWFPGSRRELNDLLDRLFTDSRARTGEFLWPSPLAFVVPHAGLVYSGTVAAAAYRTLEASKPERVVVLAFSHSRVHDGLAFPDIDAYSTPLGEFAIDTQALAQLEQAGVARRVSESMVCDHSLEIQLPLLARAAPNSRLAPLYVGRLGDRETARAATGLAGLFDGRTVFLASSDLTHFGRGFHYQPFAVNSSTAERLRELDFGVIEAAGSLAPSLFDGEIQRTGATVCGVAPIKLLLAALRQAGESEVFQQTLDYQTSGDITGDFAHSVSYGALGYFPAGSFTLGEEEQRSLLESARRTLEHWEDTRERKPIPPDPPLESLKRRAGVFVSLHYRGELRGCVGRKGAASPLADAVPELALTAWLDEPRFPKPRRESVRDLDIEISVLTPFKRVPSLESIEVPGHGVYFESGLRQALLLPQVAREYGWPRDEFLKALAKKGGVAAGVFSEAETRLYVFRAQVFGAR